MAKKSLYGMGYANGGSSQFNPYVQGAFTDERKDNFLTKTKPVLDITKTVLAAIPTPVTQGIAAGLGVIQGVGASQQKKTDAQFAQKQQGFEADQQQQYNEWLMQQEQQLQNQSMENIEMNASGGGSANYGTIGGNGNPKADDKKMSLEPGSHVVPFENAEIAKGILYMMGYNPNKQATTNSDSNSNQSDYFAHTGGNIPINISSGEVVLNPQQTNEMEQMGINPDDLSPDSEYKRNPEMQGNNMNNGGGLYRMGFGTGGGIGDPPTTIDNGIDIDKEARKAKFNNADYSGAEFDDVSSLPYSGADAYYDKMHPNDKIGTDSANPELSGEVGNYLHDIKRDRNISTVGNLAQFTYNAFQKFRPGSKPGTFTPKLVDFNTQAIEQRMDRQRQLSSATARYEARNTGTTQTMNPVINAQNLDNMIQQAAIVQGVENQENQMNTEIQNNASLYNLGNMNQFNQSQNAAQNQFRATKGQAMSQNFTNEMKNQSDYEQKRYGTTIPIEYMDKGSREYAEMTKKMEIAKQNTPEGMAMRNWIAANKPQWGITSSTK